MKLMLWKNVRRRPWLALTTAVFVVVVLALIALPVYAGYQWRAAEQALREGKANEARTRLASCLFVWPTSVKVRMAMARANRLSGRLAEAEEQLSRVMKLQGGASEATQLEFLLMRAQSGELSDVEMALFELVENNHPDSVLILETMAQANMHQLRYGPAFGCLNRLLAIDPDSAKAYHWRGWILERVNKPKPAMAEYERALELDPELVAVRLRVAEMHLEDSNPPKAIPHLERLMQQYPDRADVLARMGRARFLQGKHQEARSLLERAGAELPDDPPSLLILAKLELLDRNPAAAEAHLRRILVVDPGDTEARYQLIACLRQLGRDEEAAEAVKSYDKVKAVLDRANKLLKEEAELLSMNADTAASIGQSLLELGQERLGLHWLHEALKRDPKHSAAHEALAAHYERSGDAEKARAHRRRMAMAGSR